MAVNGNTEERSGGGFRPAHDIAVVLSFLTCLPVDVNGYRHDGLARAAWAFPVAGLVVGGIGGGILYGFAHLGWSPAIGVLLALATMVLITGALHEDGLADVADGFGGGGTVERKLDVMRDSRIGTYGALSLMLGAALKVAALYELQMDFLGALSLLAAAVLSRALLPAVMHVLPPAREDGLSVMAGRPSGLVAAISLVMGVGFCLFIVHDHDAVLVSIAVAVFCVGIVGALARGQIGGQTGDVIGSAQQAAETGFLISMAIGAGTAA